MQRTSLLFSTVAGTAEGVPGRERSVRLQGVRTENDIQRGMAFSLVLMFFPAEQNEAQKTEHLSTVNVADVENPLKRFQVKKRNIPTRKRANTQFDFSVKDIQQ